MEEDLKKLVSKLSAIIDDKNGIKISGQGMVANNTEKANELLDKIQKFLYFMEQRQTRMEKQNEEIIRLLSSIQQKGLNT